MNSDLSREQTQDNKKITTKDVAEAAGVSLATVDRVINGRSGVRKLTADKIHAAIEALGYIRETGVEALNRTKVARIRFILPDYENHFLAQMESEITLVSEHQEGRIQADIQKVPLLDAYALAYALDDIPEDEYIAVVFMGVEAAVVSEAVRRAQSRGLRVLTLVSDVAANLRDHFVGINNAAAGRTAAGLMGRFLPLSRPLPEGQGALLRQKQKKVGVLLGSTMMMDHMQRCVGFEQAIRSQFPHIEILPAIEGHDDNKLTQELLVQLFEQNPDIDGLYSLGAAKSAVVDSLKKHDLHQKVITIAHDLTPVTRQGLHDGTFAAIVHQDPKHQVRSAVRVIKALVNDKKINSSQETIRIEIYMQENMPAI